MYVVVESSLSVLLYPTLLILHLKFKFVIAAGLLPNLPTTIVFVVWFLVADRLSFYSFSGSLSLFCILVLATQFETIVLALRAFV